MDEIALLEVVEDLEDAGFVTVRAADVAYIFDEHMDIDFVNDLDYLLFKLHVFRGLHVTNVYDLDGKFTIME